MSPLSTSDKIYRERQFLLVNFAAAATEFPGDSIYCDTGPYLAGDQISCDRPRVYFTLRFGRDLYEKVKKYFCILYFW